MNSKIVFPVFLFSLLLISAGIDLNNLANYASQGQPNYITKDNTAGNPITDKGATLGRVLFYDKKLSVNNTIACASCHKQQFAFGDTACQSIGVTGAFTTRHAMRLINARFADETRFFWDERAVSLEDQTSKPIQSHDEMGFSGQNGDPGLDSLIAKMTQITYYPTLFSFVYGDPAITETRIQKALAQFVRSIQSFDSKFDAGLAQAGNLNAPFQNFTAQENQGKMLFLAPPNAGGAGCQGCHRAPEFDIDPNTRNNGVISMAGNATGMDLTNTRAPSLRDIFNPAGMLNGPLMHTGSFGSVSQVIDHYNLIPFNPANTNLDPRLAGPASNLQLTQAQKSALQAFIKTLSGTNVYTDPKWSSPFDANGNLVSNLTGIASYHDINFNLYPNPAQDYLQVDIKDGNYTLRIMNPDSREVMEINIHSSKTIDLTSLDRGILLVEITDNSSGRRSVKKVIRN